ncbi:MAG: hypothetical protein FWF50_03205, partial [Defluviitaleaceae bacterium]|nr:hypothetical protein [Defluviitaleaceae bacterium]
FSSIIDTLPIIQIPFGAYIVIASWSLRNIFFYKGVDENKKRNFKFILIFSTSILLILFFIYAAITFYMTSTTFNF